MWLDNYFSIRKELRKKGYMKDDQTDKLECDGPDKNVNCYLALGIM